MTGRYDPLPDLADLVAASVHENAIPSAVRLASKLRVMPESGVKVIEARLREALTVPVGGREAKPPALTESQRFQVQEARDVLGTWDLNNPGIISRETVLADQARALLAIIDEEAGFHG
jgi:hypothetical protein